jgi:sugar/nucleoside kinase (ribokinase family)
MPALPRLRALGWRVSAHDTGLADRFKSPDGFVELARSLDTLFINRRTAYAILDQRLATEPLVAAMAERLAAAPGRGEVVLTLGPDGAAVFRAEEGRPLRVPAPSVTIVDGTGAGDCFVGAYLAQTLHGVDAAEAAAAASYVAGLSMTAEGAQGRRVTAAEIMRTEAAGAWAEAGR